MLRRLSCKIRLENFDSLERVYLGLGRVNEHYTCIGNDGTYASFVEDRVGTRLGSVLTTQGRYVIPLSRVTPKYLAFAAQGIGWPKFVVARIGLPCLIREEIFEAV